METATKHPSRHIGHKISRIRELRGMKQDALAHELGMSQQAVSKIEQSEEVDPETLEKVAKALGVTAQGIENFSEETVFNNINNFHDNSIQNNFNPIDKIVELYDALLKEKDEKIALMERLLKKK